MKKMRTKGVPFGYFEQNYAIYFCIYLPSTYLCNFCNFWRTLCFV